MTLWIKICGLTSEADIAAAVGAGADAVGFVFAPSKRQVSTELAKTLSRTIPTHIMRVAVMQHPAQQILEDVWRVVRPDLMQIDWTDLSALCMPAVLAVLPVMRASREIPEPPPPRLLLEGPVSGAGSLADWSLAASLARSTDLVLAGGLNPVNIGQAIEQVRPFGVDVSSGVERAPGQKDPALIEQFISNARTAALK